MQFCTKYRTESILHICVLNHRPEFCVQSTCIFSEQYACSVPFSFLYFFWRMPSSGVWRRVDVVDWTDVSEERIASIFRVEKSASEEPAWAGSCSCLKMEAIRSSETSVQSTTSTQRHTPEDGILHSHRRENLKSYIYFFCLFLNFSSLLTALSNGPLEKLILTLLSYGTRRFITVFT
jgi:hypothetical protein